MPTCVSKLNSKRETSTNNKRLSKARLRRLVDCFIRQSTRSRDYTDSSAFVNDGRHDANFALVRSHNARTIGPDESTFALIFEHG